ncbi:hypothetical protein AOB60_01175 [Streptomyces noursei]|uniref:Uncharacterized protein n=1 Tax=Streptomyces noursei TaxID=1971 RepID=A0A2N8PRB3_STRNR|nr:hypothetical protein AOB60_01175 [Streptomyces noursei]
MLNELMRDIERGTIRNQQVPLALRDDGNHHANDKGLCHVTAEAAPSQPHTRIESDHLVPSASELVGVHRNEFGDLEQVGIRVQFEEACQDLGVRLVGEQVLRRGSSSASPWPCGRRGGGRPARWGRDQVLSERPRSLRWRRTHGPPDSVVTGVWRRARQVRHQGALAATCCSGRM